MRAILFAGTMPAESAGAMLADEAATTPSPGTCPAPCGPAGPVPPQARDSWGRLPLEPGVRSCRCRRGARRSAAPAWRGSRTQSGGTAPPAPSGAAQAARPSGTSSPSTVGARSLTHGRPRRHPDCLLIGGGACGPAARWRRAGFKCCLTRRCCLRRGSLATARAPRCSALLRSTSPGRPCWHRLTSCGTCPPRQSCRTCGGCAGHRRQAPASALRWGGWGWRRPCQKTSLQRFARLGSRMQVRWGPSRHAPEQRPFHPAAGHGRSLDAAP